MEEIIKLIEEKTGVENISEDSELENDLGCSGDDFSELIEEYSKKFNVDMSGYLWYFHHYEEPMTNLFSYRSPAKAVKQIPITPKILYRFSKTGKWDIEYPQHELPNNRKPILANKILLLTFVIGVIYYIVYKLFN